MTDRCNAMAAIDTIHLVGIVDHALVSDSPPDAGSVDARMRELALDGLCHLIDWHPDTPIPMMRPWGTARQMVCWRVPPLSGARADGFTPEQTLPLFERLLWSLADNPVRLGGRPLFAVFQLDAFADPGACASAWRAQARACGIGEIALAAVHFRWQGDPRLYGFDAAISLPPLGCRAENRPDLPDAMPSVRDYIPPFHYRALARQRLQSAKPAYRLLEAVPSGLESIDVDGIGRPLPTTGASPAALSAWLNFAIPKTRLRAPEGERILFLSGLSSLLASPETTPVFAMTANAIRAGIGGALPLPSPFETLPGPDAVLADAEVLENEAWTRAVPGPDTVSVILPSYNHARYLRGAIDSVIAQTWPDVELIVVDDGSQDGSPSLLREILAACQRPMRVLLQTNRGAHEAINRGLAVARGEILAILNSDDAYLPQRLEIMVQAMRERGALLGFSGVRVIDDNGEAVSAMHPFVNALQPLMNRVRQARNGTEFTLILATGNAAISTGNLVFRRGLLAHTGGMRAMTGNHDWDFVLAASTVLPPLFVDQPLYRYRLHDSNTITQHALLSAIEVECCLVRVFGLKPMLLDPEHRLFAWSSPGPVVRSRNYSDWLLRTRNDQPAGIEPSAATSPISILLPTYNTPEIWLRKCIDSVLAQTWTHWELCIADDASSVPHVRAVLEEYARRDARIRLSFRPENGHISASSNSALELAHGKFFVLLDHDDVLAPDALAWVAAEIDAHSDAELIYSDEDKIDEFGVRTSPYFKAAYNPELLRAQNCISHLGVFRTKSVREIGGFRTGFEGAQDWDLALRICDRTGPERIRHIPRVLYHWRAIQGSTALATGEKPYVIAAQKKSIEEHLARLGLAATLFHPENLAHWGTRLAPYPATPWIFVFDLGSAPGAPLQWLGTVVSRCRPQPTRILLLAPAPLDGAFADALARMNLPPWEWLHIDPSGDTAPAVAALLARIGSGVVFLLRYGALPPHPDSFIELAARAQLAHTGLVGVKAVTQDQRIAYAGTLLMPAGRLAYPYRNMSTTTRGQIGRACLAQNFTVLQGPCLVFDIGKLARLEGWNAPVVARHLDLELSLRFHTAGLRNVWVPYQPFLQPVVPMDDPILDDDVARLSAIWPELFEHDPTYNSNLSASDPLFEIAAIERNLENP